MYHDRKHAGQVLAGHLRRWAEPKPVVLGLPRGGVVVAAELARALPADLDVVLVKKLRSPFNPELAEGAMGEDGQCVWNEYATSSDAYREAERRARWAELEAQREVYRAVKPPVSVTGRTAILVDDGLATGATMRAAVQVVKLANPAEVIVAVPVGPPDTVEQLSREVTVVCPVQPPWFSGVGEFYADFRQVSDHEVVTILREFAHGGGGDR
ncbi:MAG: phosphoribosyltransferase family protein [Verrucomicrobiae bacterium]|nr:phosphoribosyltransferase family protein [Verrucomicrobiae bacterium]